MLCVVEFKILPNVKRNTMKAIIKPRSVLLTLMAASLLPVMSGLGESLPVPTYKDKPVPPANIQKIEEALPQRAFAKPAKKRRLLVVSATHGFRHSSIPTGKIALRLMGEKTGAFEAVVSDDPANFEPEVLATFDAVCLLSPTQDFLLGDRKAFSKLPRAEQEARRKLFNRCMDNLVQYVKNGGGLMGIHAATDACYNHKAYGDTIGGYFAGHPWTAGMKVTIVVEEPEHRLNQLVFSEPDFQIREEIYQFRQEPYSREKVRVLLHLDPERSEKPRDPSKVRQDGDFPVCWVHQVGKGKVFYTSLGHNEHIYWNPLLLKHYLAGIQFAMGDLEAEASPVVRP